MLLQELLILHIISYLNWLILILVGLARYLSGSAVTSVYCNSPLRQPFFCFKPNCKHYIIFVILRIPGIRKAGFFKSYNERHLYYTPHFKHFYTIAPSIKQCLT